MKDKGLKLLIGCAMVSLGGFVLLGVGCFSFSHWLNSPGELLEPRQLLAADARGYVEWRMELENPATAQLVRSFLDILARRSQDMVNDESSFLQAFETWNRNRQEEDFKRLFPATASWTFYPGDSDQQGSHLFAVSIRAAANQLIVADWVLGLMAPRTPELQTFDFRGERVLVFDRDESAGSEKVYGFLHPKGVFVGTNQIALGYAIESLRSHAGDRTGEASSLDELFDDLPSDYQMRGAIDNENDSLSAIVDALFSEHPELIGLAASMHGVSSLTLGGAVDQLGDASLVFDFRGGSPALGDRLNEAADVVGRAFAAHDIVVLSEVLARDDFAGGWTLRLRIEDFAAAVERSAERSIELERSAIEVEETEYRGR